VMDERNARREQERRFNFASLIDEPLAGFMAGASVKIIPQLSRPEPVLSGQWQMVFLFVGGAVGLAAVLELLRPSRPAAREERVDLAPLAQSIQPQFQRGGRWLYWEKQDPLWGRCLVVVMTVFFAAIAVDLANKYADYHWLLFAFLAVLTASSYGGIHIVLTPGRFTMRSGRLGLTILRLKLANVHSVELMNFNALADGFGWGLYRYSFSLRAWGFILGGKRGVMIQMKSGRKFLISSNTPEKIAATTEAARIAAMR